MLLRSVLLLCVLGLPVILARINIDVNVEFQTEDADPTISISAVGSNKELISDEERSTFGVTDYSLKKCVEAYAGRTPTDAYVRGPTPWNNLYARYDWPETNRIIRSARATVIDVGRKTLLASRKRYINTHDFEAKGKFSFTHSVTKTVETTWEKGGSFTYGGEVGISVGIKAVELSASGHFEVTNTWGESTRKSVDESISDTAEMEFVVKPFSEVIAVGYLTATKATIKVEYEAVLEGDVACNYDPPFNGHHFHAYNINRVLKACKRPTSIPTIEYIKLDVISGSRITITEGEKKQTGLVNNLLDTTAGLVGDLTPFKRPSNRRPVKDNIPTEYL